MIYAACLYCLLCSDDYRVREHAARQLVRLVDGWPQCYGPRVTEWATDASHPEVSFRVRPAVNVYTTFRVNGYVPAGIPAWPVCDAYPLPGSFGLDVRDRSAGMTYYRPRPEDRSAPYWDAYRRATQDFIRAELRAGMTPAAADRLLRRWWACERADRSDCGAEHQATIESWTWTGGYPESP